MGKKHGTDGILCRQVPVPGYSARILPSKTVPVPEYRAHVFVWVPLKCYIHIGAHAWRQTRAPSLDMAIYISYHTFQIGHQQVVCLLSQRISHYLRKVLKKTSVEVV